MPNTHIQRQRDGTERTQHDESIDPVGFLELELTGKCQLECRQCYADSGPRGTHGAMMYEDWCRVIREAGDYGISTVQLIGGEPTVHPRWTELLRYALDEGLAVQLFTNLYHIKQAWWEVLSEPSVRIATSYYSDVASEHDAITHRQGSHTRTRANIVEAVRRGIPVRVEVYQVLSSQRVEGARAELAALGVVDIHTDRTHLVGRAQRGPVPRAAELCGECGDGRAAVKPDGTVTPCVMGSWLGAGNVQRAPLGQILDGPLWTVINARIPRTPSSGQCPPGACPPSPDACGPANGCGPHR